MDTVYTDSLGFLAPPGVDPVFGPNRPGVSLIHLTSVPPLPGFMDFGKALAAHKAFMGQALSNADTHAVLARGDVKRSGSMGILFGMQHAPNDLTRERVRELYDAGVRVMALAYKDATEYGNGFAVPLGGLTHRGREVIRVMADVGIILDLSHANQRTAGNALDFISSKNIRLNVMASHSGASSVFPHPRNLTDYLMQGVVGLKGYIGIPAVTFMLTKKLEEGRSYLPAFVEHIAHAIAVCGANAVGIGSDGIHGNMTLFQANNHFEEMARMINTDGLFRAYFPDRPIEIITHGKEMFTVFERRALASLEPGTRTGVLGGNFMAFLRRSLPQA